MEDDQKSRKDSIAVYHNAKMDTGYYDGDADENEACEVKLGNGEIIISYEDENDFTIYRGKEISEGHFVVDCPEKNGKGSLHRFPKSQILEGFWIEDGTKGFWRIFLN